jgi:hypothetical protein
MPPLVYGGIWISTPSRHGCQKYDTIDRMRYAPKPHH